MKKENKELIASIIGVIFIIFGFALIAIYLLVETKKEVPLEWIYISIGIGLALIIARKQLIAFANSWVGKFIKKK